MCKRFRQFLLDKYTGETPLNYYARFKWVVKAATKAGYFQNNPTEDIACKSNPSVRIKDNLEVEDYLSLITTLCGNQEVMAAFLFCCYTGLRWIDVSKMVWSDIKGAVLATRLIQEKTKQPVTLTLHEIAKRILDNLGEEALHNHFFDGLEDKRNIYRTQYHESDILSYFTDLFFSIINRLSFCEEKVLMK